MKSSRRGTGVHAKRYPGEARPAPTKERVMDTGSKISRDEREDEADAKARIHKEQQRALDKALEETFPGSDPVNVVQPAKSKQEKRHEKSPTEGGRSA
jgi:hypothetical protein